MFGIFRSQKYKEPEPKPIESPAVKRANIADEMRALAKENVEKLTAEALRKIRESAEQGKFSYTLHTDDRALVEALREYGFHVADHLGRPESESTGIWKVSWR